MSFLAPAAFAFAAAIPVVIVFYMLKRKRVVKLVPSTLLWQRFLNETQASAPFQKLRHNWLLLLQILLLLLAVFALARPYFAGEAKQSRLRVVVLDGSASMQATDVKPSRFESARAEALKWVDGLKDGEQMMVLLAGANTEVKQSPTSDKTALRRALNACAVSDAPTRLAEALKTASAFTYERKGEEEVTSGEIHLFSDGAFPPLGELENKNLPLVYHRVGQSGNNVGIVSLDVRANPNDPAQRAVFTSVANLSAEERPAEIELLFDREVLEVRPVTLAPTNTQPFIFLAPQNRDGVFTVRLKAEADHLAPDNEAAIVSLLPQPARVLLVTRGNRFLEKALRAPPNVELSVSQLLTDAAEAFDLVVLDDVIPAVWPKPNTLAIHTVNTNWFAGWQAVKGPPIVDWKSTHPLLRFVNFDNVQIAETLGVKAPDWGVSLVDSPQTPLLVVGEREGQRIIWIGFDLLQSTWPLRISFPIFIANAVEWLNPASANASQLLVRAGDAFRLGLAHPVPGARVVAPDGSARTLEVEPGGRELIYNTSQRGVHRLTAGTNEVTFCVNLLDAAESNIQPREELPFGKYGKVTATTMKRANVELWRWILVGGLAVLLFEWWFYHKRTA